jgi:tight adherence protein B
MTPAPFIAAGALALLAAATGRGRARRRLQARLLAPAEATAPRRRVSPAALAVGVVGVATAAVTAGPRAVALLAVVALAGPSRDRLHRRAARRHRRESQLPTALDRMAAALRTGSSLPMAIDEVGGALDPPLGPELRAVAGEIARGRPAREALDAWASAHGDAGTRLAASALVLSTVVGSTPARAIDGVAATVRERLDLIAERRAMAAQARTSALVLSVAPVAFAAVLVLADTAAARFLVGTPAGWACLASGVILDAAGAWWMARLSRSDAW